MKAQQARDTTTLARGKAGGDGHANGTRDDEAFQRTHDLLWSARGVPRRGPKPSLSVERIVAAAVAIADAEGLDAVSMQRVARECSVTAMALYRYVPSKAELVALMLDIGLGAPPPLAGAPEDWRAQAEDWARRLWAVFRAHPWSLAATAPARVMGPNELRWFEALVGALMGAGLTGAEAVHAVIALLLHVRGMAASAPTTASESRSWGDMIIGLLRAHGENFPALAAAQASGAFGAPHGADLEFGLRLLLDGLSERIATSASAGPRP